MSEDSAWSIEDSGSAATTPRPPAESVARPGLGAGPGTGTGTDTGVGAGVAAGVNTGVGAPSGFGSGYGPGFGAGLGEIQRPRVADPDRVLWLIIAGLLFFAGVAQIGYLSSHSETISAGQHNYDILALDGDHGTQAVLLVGCGVLLLLRRTRALAAGLVLSVSLLAVAFDFGVLRPAVLHRQDGLARWSSVGGLGVLAFAGVLALVAVARQDRPPAARRRQRRTDRVAAVALGFVGAAFLFLGVCLDSFQVRLDSAPDASAFQCCGWSQVDGWQQIGMAVGGTTMVVLAVFAATLRWKVLAAGMLLAVAWLPLAKMVEYVLVLVEPEKSFVGFDNPSSSFASLRLSAVPMGGFWVTLIGILLLVAAAVSRLRFGRRENPYSAQPYAPPGRPAS